MTELFDLNVERAVIGSLATTFQPSPADLLRTYADIGVTPDSFSARHYAALFTAVANTIRTGGNPTDEVLLAAALADDPRVPNPRYAINSLWEAEFSAENAIQHAEQLVAVARRRADQAAGLLLIEAAKASGAERDEKRARAVTMLTRPDTSQAAVMMPARLSADFIERSNQGPPERYPMPWDALTKRMNGGIARKQALVIGGWSGDGKSATFDAVMWALSSGGLRSMAYLTEMGFEERFDRNMARIARVPYSRIDDNTYQRDERFSKRILQATTDYAARGFAMVEARGWTADEVCADIALNQWDVVGVDIVHEIEHRDERELGSIVSRIRHAAAKVNAICILCVHLNDARNTGAQRPLPVARDIRGTGMIHRGADFVLFVYRNPDENGLSTDEGVFKLDKVRKGRPGLTPADFDGEYMAWMVRAGDYEVAA